MFSEISKGKWWDRALTLNVGCTPVSTECLGCWERAVADQQMSIFGMNTPYFGLLDGDGAWTGSVRETPVALNLPKLGQEPKCWAVWTDLFHEDVTFALQMAAFRLFLICTNHLFVVCTKRPQRAAERIHMIKDSILAELIQNATNEQIAHLHEHLFDNVIIMTTAGTQENYEARMKHLVQVPLKNKALSMEPLLEPISLYLDQPASIFGLKGHKELVSTHLCWVITGGETENRLFHAARPTNPHWSEAIRLQCKYYGVNFLHKHNGCWIINEKTGKMEKVGHRKAGRKLFGEVYNGLPVPAVKSIIAKTVR